MYLGRKADNDKIIPRDLLVAASCKAFRLGSLKFEVRLGFSALAGHGFSEGHARLSIDCPSISLDDSPLVCYFNLFSDHWGTQPRLTRTHLRPPRPEVCTLLSIHWRLLGKKQGRRATDNLVSHTCPHPRR